MDKIKVILITIIVLLVIATCVVAHYVLARPWAKFDAKFKNDIKQEYIIQDADTRIATYEWFYDQYEQIQATRLKAEIAKGTQEESGIQMVLASMIADYNAMARKQHTRAQWMPSDLPYQIEISLEEE